MSSAEQVINRIFHGLVNALFVAILVAGSFLLVRSAGFVPVDSKLVSVNNTPDYALGGIQGESILQQTFKAKRPVDTIGIRMATYDRKNAGEIYLRVYNQKTGVTLTQNVKPAAQLVDNDFNLFRLDSVIPADGQTYVIEVSGTSPNQQQSAGVWCSYTDTYKDGELTVNEFKTDGDLVFLLGSPQTASTAGAILAAAGLGLLLLLTIVGWLLFTRHENRRQV